MNFVPAAVSLLLLLLSSASGFFLVSRIRRGVSPGRFIPLLIELSLALLLLSLAMLPQGLPSIFERILGHSITSDYVFPQTMDGTRVTETWISARWWKPIGTFFSVAMVIGLAWSIWNLRKKTERTANTLALALGVLWAVAIFMNTLNSIVFR
ncbi:MAG: hypothetical protein ACHQLQ_01955 [Candidatus Acidiferrales bacterium]